MHTLKLHLTHFIRDHDDLPAFHAAYLLFYIAVAFLFSMGVFAILIVIHILFDFVKYHYVLQTTGRETVKGMIKENLSDCALLVVGLTVAVVFHHELGIAAVSGLFRTQIMFVRIIGTTLSKMEIIHSFLTMIFGLTDYMHKKKNISGQWSPFEKTCFIIILIGIGMYLAAPLMLGIGSNDVQSVIQSEMTPRLLH